MKTKPFAPLPTAEVGVTLSFNLPQVTVTVMTNFLHTNLNESPLVYLKADVNIYQSNKLLVVSSKLSCALKQQKAPGSATAEVEGSDIAVQHARF